MGKIDGKRGVWLIADTLPIPKVKASQFPVHISYFLQKYKKGKSQKKDLPIEKRYHNQLRRCQNSRYIADTCNVEKQHLSLKKAEPDDPAHF
jgi:hypothetical protein